MAIVVLIIKVRVILKYKVTPLRNIKHDTTASTVEVVEVAF